jgi:UDP-N-acetylglucosamine:LPS N-acetylglucosamine transferase
VPRSGRPLVVILTAKMGAGHEQVGRELVRRLDSRGVDGELLDIAELLPRGVGAAMTQSYRFMACRAQWLYEFTYRASMCPQVGSRPNVAPLALPAGRRFLAFAERERPSLVVSTFHLASQVLGRLRARGELRVPVVSLLLDFFVHGMWVSEGVDAHLLLHRCQLPQLAARGGRAPVVCGPVVRSAFTPEVRAKERPAARASLGVGAGQCCVVIVAGSWGVGSVAETLKALRGAGRFVPVVATGQNRRLYRELSGWPGAIVLGWVEHMEQLFAAADVVVENAGGLTAMEAMAAGVPVVSHAPIAGHGRANAEEMHKAGVSLYARSSAELLGYLDLLSANTVERERLVQEASAMFCADAAEFLSSWARGGAAPGTPLGAAEATGDRPEQAPSAGVNGKLVTVELPLWARP